MFKGIDFFSDTLTKPSLGMRKAMVEAEVGDEQKGEDPTTLKLEEKVAELLGHSCALFFPSASMANEVALKTLTDPGDELIADNHCHLLHAEAGGPAIHAQLITRGLKTDYGIFTGAQVCESFQVSKGPHYPITKIVSVENTTNMGGGIAWKREELEEVLETAKELGLKTHLDGARLFNASVKSKMSPKAIASPFNTATICLSKGLGCPMGAVLAFDKSLFPRVRRLKQVMGGALRQSGIIAAAGLYALNHNIDRLEEDHINAAHFSDLLAEEGRYIKVEKMSPSTATNMVFFRWECPKMTDTQFLARVTEKGVRFSHVGPNRFRAVTHLDVRREDIPRAANIVRGVCSEI